MFIHNKTIHYPDSKQQLQLEPWLSDKVIQIKNEEANIASDRNIKIDNRKYIDEIQEGLYYLEINHDVIYIGYILPAGLYNQQIIGNPNKTITIPLPRLYIQAKLELGYNSRGWRIDYNSTHIHTKLINTLPLTNIYSDSYIQMSELSVYDANRGGLVCDNNVMSHLVGRKSSKIEIVNGFVNNIHTYLLTGGNNDLSPLRNLSREDTLTADYISYRLAIAYKLSTSITKRYTQYWILLEYLMNKELEKGISVDVAINNVYTSLYISDDISHDDLIAKLNMDGEYLANRLIELSRN